MPVDVGFCPSTFPLTFPLDRLVVVLDLHMSSWPQVGPPLSSVLLVGVAAQGHWGQKLRARAYPVGP